MMKRLFLTIALVFATVFGAAAQEIYEDVNPNIAVAGTFYFDGPVVQAKGTSFWSKICKPFATSKVKRKIKNAFKDAGLDGPRLSLELKQDGSFAVRANGLRLFSGSYTYNLTDNKLTLKFLGIPAVSGVVKKNGKRIEWAQKVDAFLWLVNQAHFVFNNDVLDAIANFSRKYTDVSIGVAMKR